jgi:hypothetical protein
LTNFDFQYKNDEYYNYKHVESNQPETDIFLAPNFAW